MQCKIENKSLSCIVCALELKSASPDNRRNVKIDVRNMFWNNFINQFLSYKNVYLISILIISCLRGGAIVCKYEILAMLKKVIFVWIKMFFHTFRASCDFKRDWLNWGIDFERLKKIRKS